MNDLTKKEPVYDPQDLERPLVSRGNTGDLDGMTSLYELDGWRGGAREALVKLNPPSIPLTSAINIDLRVLGFAGPPTICG